MKLMAALVAGAVALAVGCGADGTTETTPTAIESPTANTETTESQDAGDNNPLAEPEHEWTVRTESSELDIILATPDLAPGERRFAIVITDSNGVVPLPFVNLTSYLYSGSVDNPGERPEPSEMVGSQFHPFPYGGRGIHVAQFNFTEPGTWGVEARLPRADGSIEYVEVLMPVGETTESVDIGEQPPRSMNRTIANVSDIAELTTGSMRNPDLYQTTVADAMDSGKPTVVVFASPAFCTNAVCGPQVEVLSNISDQFGAQANYIHVDLFENPHEIQGDLTRAILSPLLEEWGLVSQEWSFVLDSEGLITGRFENFAPESELIDSLRDALGAS